MEKKKNISISSVLLLLCNIECFNTFASIFVVTFHGNKRSCVQIKLRSSLHNRKLIHVTRDLAYISYIYSSKDKVADVSERFPWYNAPLLYVCIVLLPVVLNPTSRPTWIPNTTIHTYNIYFSWELVSPEAVTSLSDIVKQTWASYRRTLDRLAIISCAVQLHRRLYLNVCCIHSSIILGVSVYA